MASRQPFDQTTGKVRLIGKPTRGRCGSDTMRLVEYSRWHAEPVTIAGAWLSALQNPEPQFPASAWSKHRRLFGQFRRCRPGFDPLQRRAEARVDLARTLPVQKAFHPFACLVPRSNQSQCIRFSGRKPFQSNTLVEVTGSHEKRIDIQISQDGTGWRQAVNRGGRDENSFTGRQAKISVSVNAARVDQRKTDLVCQMTVRTVLSCLGVEKPDAPSQIRASCCPPMRRRCFSKSDFVLAAVQSDVPF